MLNLLASVPEIDMERHSLAPVVSPVSLALLIAAPLVLGRRAPYDLRLVHGLVEGRHLRTPPATT